MTVAGAAYEYEREVEPAPVEPWSVALVERDWVTASTEVDLAPLGLPTAEHRRERRVVISVETDRGRADLPLPLRVERHGARDGSAFRVSGSQYRLTLTFALSADAGEIQWHLGPGGRDAAGRAAVLDLLIAMSGKGVLVLTDPEHGVLARLRLDGHTLDESLSDERRFLTDVLIIETWSGRRLPLPDEIDDSSGKLIAHLAHWIRHRRVRVRFESISGLTPEPVEGADELRLHENVEYRLFGIWIPLGRLNYRVPVTVIDSRPQGDLFRTRFRASRDWLTASITPPLGRASIRRVRAVDAGEILRPVAPRRTRRREQTRGAAQELVESWELDRPEDDAVRDDIRRRWPT